MCNCGNASLLIVDLTVVCLTMVFWGAIPLASGRSLGCWEGHRCRLAEFGHFSAVWYGLIMLHG